jgi:hypothetical protein
MLNKPTTTMAPFTVPLPNHLWPLRIIPVSFIFQSLSFPERRRVRFLFTTLQRPRYPNMQRTTRQGAWGTAANQGRRIREDTPSIEKNPREASCVSAVEAAKCG